MGFLFWVFCVFLLLYSQSLAYLHSESRLDLQIAGAALFLFIIASLFTFSSGIGPLPAFDNRPLFTIHHYPHPTLYLHLDVLANLSRTYMQARGRRLLESCI